MNFPEKVIVTDQEIDISSMTGSQKGYFLNLANRIHELYVVSNKSRYVVGISGPSGSGKSVLAEIIKPIFNEKFEAKIYPLDIDAYHFTKEELESKGLLDVKGRYDTLDAKSLRTTIDAFVRGDSIQLPYYSRKDHEPHHDGEIIDRDKAILLIQGLWIQRNDPLWKDVRSVIDYSFCIEGSSQTFKQNTIERHIRGGRTSKDAESFYNSSGLKNEIEYSENSAPCNGLLRYYADY